METVGVIGVGMMGRAFVEHLRKAGLNTVVFDTSNEAVERAVALGAVAGESSAAVAAAADIVDVVVRNDEEMLEAMLGPDGAVEGLSPGKLLLLHSTIHPRTTQKVAEAGWTRGAEVADACIVGVPDVVGAGGAVCLLGADPELADRVTPHLLRFTKRVFLMGPLGAGNAAKIIKNMLTASERLVLAEALRIGEAAGVPYVRALNMMSQLDSANVLEHWERTFDPNAPTPTLLVSNHPTPFGTPGNLYHKDFPLAKQLADDYGVDAPITRGLDAARSKLAED